MVAVAPATLAYETPLLLLTCHCTVGGGVPEAPAAKLTDVPALTVWLLGLVVATGGVLTTFVVPTAAALASVAVADAVASLPLLGLDRFREKVSLDCPAAGNPATLTVMVLLV